MKIFVFPIAPGAIDPTTKKFVDVYLFHYYSSNVDTTQPQQLYYCVFNLILNFLKSDLLVLTPL